MTSLNPEKISVAMSGFGDEAKQLGYVLGLAKELKTAIQNHLAYDAQFQQEIDTEASKVEGMLECALMGLIYGYD